MDWHVFNSLTSNPYFNLGWATRKKYLNTPAPTVPKTPISSDQIVERLAEPSSDELMERIATSSATPTTPATTPTPINTNPVWRPVVRPKPAINTSPVWKTVPQQATAKTDKVIQQLVPDNAEIPAPQYSGPQPTAADKFWGTKVVGDLPLDTFVNTLGRLSKAFAPRSTQGRVGGALAEMSHEAMLRREARERLAEKRREQLADIESSRRWQEGILETKQRHAKDILGETYKWREKLQKERLGTQENLTNRRIEAANRRLEKSLASAQKIAELHETGAMKRAKLKEPVYKEEANWYKSKATNTATKAITKPTISQKDYVNFRSGGMPVSLAEMAQYNNEYDNMIKKGLRPAVIEKENGGNEIFWWKVGKDGKKVLYNTLGQRIRIE